MNEVEALKVGERMYERHTVGTGDKVSEEDFVKYLSVSNKALEKKIASKPFEGGMYYCCDCMFPLRKVIFEYCPSCGRKIDWS